MEGWDAGESWRESVYGLKDDTNSRGVVLGLPIRRNSLLGRFKKRYVSGRTGQIRIPLEAARIQEPAYLCDLEEMRRAGRIVLFKYPSASPRRRGRATFARAHLVRIS